MMKKLILFLKTDEKWIEKAWMKNIETSFFKYILLLLITDPF